MELDWFFVGKDIQIQIKGDFDRESFYDLLGDLILCNEINDTDRQCDFLCYSSMVFDLSEADVENLERRGWCRAYFIGTLKQRLDLTEDSHLNFAKWYYGVETEEEVLKIIN